MLTFAVKSEHVVRNDKLRDLPAAIDHHFADADRTCDDSIKIVCRTAFAVNLPPATNGNRTASHVKYFRLISLFVGMIRIRPLRGLHNGLHRHPRVPEDCEGDIAGNKQVLKSDMSLSPSTYDVD